MHAEGQRKRQQLRTLSASVRKMAVVRPPRPPLALPASTWASFSQWTGVWDAYTTQLKHSILSAVSMQKRGSSCGHSVLVLSFAVAQEAALPMQKRGSCCGHSVLVLSFAVAQEAVLLV